MAYNGSSKIVSSSFLYSTLQSFYTKIKGLLDKKLDCNIHVAQGAAGKNGYVAFAQINITKNYVNRPTEFTLIRRGAPTPCYVSLTFKNLDGVDPDINTLTYSGYDYGVFAQKTDTSTWLLYYHKSESYDSVTVAKTHSVQDGVKITYIDILESTKPKENIINAVLGYDVGHSQTSTEADTATKLKTARTIQTNLSSTSSTSFDGSSNVTPGITGVLPVTNGGTGQNSVSKAANAFINSLATGDSVPKDNDYFISQYVGGGETSTTYHRRPISLLWEYIKDKTDKLYSLSSHTHKKSDVSDLNIKLTNEDLNTIKNVGFYHGGGDNSVINKPESVDAFGLIVLQSANGWYTQLLYASNLGKQLYTRWYDGSTWTSWVKETYIKNLSISGKNITYTKTDGTTGTITTQDTNTTYSAATISAAGLMSASDKTKLDGIATGANKYSLPTASSSTLGGVKTTSTVTSNSGYTACPIISGVPYYKDTNTTYGGAGSSLGLVKTGGDVTINSGVITVNDDSHNHIISNVDGLQSALDSKANKTHGHSPSDLMYSSAIDLSASTYDQDTYYPVVGEGLSINGFSHIKVAVQLDSGTKPTWSTHDRGFTCNMDLLVVANGWGVTRAQTIALDYSYLWANSNPCGYQQLNCASLPVLWLRGGGKYFVWHDYDTTWNIKTSEFVSHNDTVAPTTTNPGMQFIYSNIYAHLKGNADTATQATNADTVDGFHSGDLQKVMIKVPDNSNVLEYAENYPVIHYDGTFFTYRVYNGYGEPFAESKIGSGDYYYYANKLDDKWITIIAVDVRSTNMYMRSKNNGVWCDSWRNISDGGNADRLDNYHGDSYMFNYNNYGASYFGSNDLNKWTRGGSYAIQSDCANAPAGRGTDTWGTILVVRGLSDRVSQYAIFWNESGQPLWHRCLNGSSWTSWVKVRDGGHANTSLVLSGWNDNRYVNTIPNDYNAKLEVKGLKSNASINSPDNSSFSTVLGLRAWADYTGGDAHELAFTAKGQMFQRHGSTDAWSKWNMMYTSENITYGTFALTPGSSALESGHIYLQYE
jgi:hypothetical protein